MTLTEDDVDPASIRLRHMNTSPGLSIIDTPIMPGEDVFDAHDSHIRYFIVLGLIGFEFVQ
jgi:hypothetical protein